MVGDDDVGVLVSDAVEAGDAGDVRPGGTAGRGCGAGVGQHRPEAGVAAVAQQVSGYRRVEHGDQRSLRDRRGRVTVRDVAVGVVLGSGRDEGLALLAHNPSLPRAAGEPRQQG
jgi:hypothetical protein